MKLIDLGEFWESKTGQPIPLGGIFIRRDIPENIRQQVNGLIHQSLQQAFAAYPVLSPYVKAHAQEMDEQFMRQHIDLYVNEFSLDLGKEGWTAIEKLKELTTP